MGTSAVMIVEIPNGRAGCWVSSKGLSECLNPEFHFKPGIIGHADVYSTVFRHAQ